MHLYEKALIDTINSNNDVIICTAETRFAMRNLPDLIEDKFLDVGISEQTLIGSVAGLSKMGMIPIAHALASFLLYRPYEFIRTDLGIPNLKSILVGSFNGFISQANGPTHQAVEDISLMSLVPNMRIIAPSNIHETCSLVSMAVDNINSPIYLRFNDTDDGASHDKSSIKWDQNRFYSTGKDILVISYGLCFNIIKDIFEDQFERVGLVNSIFIKPMLVDFYETVFSSYSKLIIVEDHKYQGGLCYEIKNLAFDMGYKGEIHGINLGSRFFKPALLEESMEYEGFSKKQLTKKIKDLI